jgi:hypothetical protein
MKDYDVTQLVSISICFIIILATIMIELVFWTQGQYTNF